ncbi:MAG: dTDP-4-dehydrorhamnose 3,5-epimerase [Bacteroidetes bacterium]|nr:MAG: dTDP-4-dehydrorhamnose 3,5-epimerase [Bacteroidota bacterium]
MKAIETPLSGCWIIQNSLVADERGYFFESFNHQKFADATGWTGQFVQDNESQSSANVVRGMHLQLGQHAQAKLVRVLHGRVLDVALDLRPHSPTFGQHFAIELSDDNARQLFVPRGFAHGFSVLSPSATFFYKCDNYYNKNSELGIHPYDSQLGINWQVSRENAILSAKDAVAQSWQQALSIFTQQTH